MRSALALALGAGLRALALAAVAAVRSDVEPGFRAAFLATWTAIFLPLTLLLGALERPLLGAFADRRAAAGAALLAGLFEGALLAWLLPVARALGAGGAIAFAAAGLPAALVPSRLSETRPRRAALGAALLVAVGALALAIDPEARYGERYAENRLSGSQLSAPPLFPDRDPASLSDLEVARAIAATYMRTHPPERLRWSWEEAVAVEGLLAVGRAAGDPEPERYVQAWIEARAAEALREPLWADACAPGLAALALRARSESARAICARLDRYFASEAPRTSRGVPSHPGLLVGGLVPAQAWVDSLMMHGVYLARAGRLDEARALGRGMAEHLRDPASGLFRHAAVELFGREVLFLPVEPVFWARGNAWAAYLYAESKKPADASPLLSAIDERQDPATGLWPTDLSRPPGASNPLETSASALLVASLRRALAADLVAPADRDRLAAAARRGASGLRSRIRWDRGHPTVLGTSTGTHPGFRAYYRRVPLDENVGHGVGAAMMALSAAQP